MARVATGAAVDERTAEDLSREAREVWALGDYPAIGELLAPAADVLVSAAGVATGDRVLDIGTGSGNVALAAARVGAEVTALDLSEAWFHVVRDRAARAGVEVELVVGDVQQLPEELGSFDAVLSSFAAIFAPAHDRVATELTRVVRHGGTLAFTAWPPASESPRISDAFYRRLPPPPSWAGSPVDWSDLTYVQRRFGDAVVGWRSETHRLELSFPDLEAYERLMLDSAGAIIAARAQLERTGEWEDALAEFRDLVRSANEATDGSVRITAPYRLLVGTRP